MVEQALTELFFLQGPDKDGALGEKQVAKLNRTLARLYDSGPEEFAADAAAPPPEPLPRGTMRYPAFRSHVHRAVTRFTDNALAKVTARLIIDFERPASCLPVVMLAVYDHFSQEQVMARLILEAKKKEDLADLEIAWSGGIIPNERPMVDEHVIELEELTAEESNKNVACWGPQTVLSDEKVQQLRGYLEVLKEAGKGEKTQQTIEAAKNLGQRALESSKQVLEIARESFQKQSEFVSQKSFHKQAFCDEPGPDGLCENTGRPQAASRLMAAARLAACARQPVAEAELPAHEVCEEQCSETIKLESTHRTPRRVVAEGCCSMTPSSRELTTSSMRPSGVTCRPRCRTWPPASAPAAVAARPSRARRRRRRRACGCLLRRRRWRCPCRRRGSRPRGRRRPRRRRQNGQCGAMMRATACMSTSAPSPTSALPAPATCCCPGRSSASRGSTAARMACSS